MKTRVAVAEGPGEPFALRDAELERPRADEVLVRVAGSGICHTDLIARDQVIPVPLPAVLGHEASGVVEAVGDAVSHVAPGDQVVLTFLSCGDCAACTGGSPAYCADMPRLNFSGRRGDGTQALSHDGKTISSHFFGQSSFATHAIAHRRNTVKVDGGSLPIEMLGPLGCGIQTGAGTVLRVLDSASQHSIAIFGGGAVGMSAVLAAAARGCRRIILVEPHGIRRALALELGATHVIDPTTEPDVAAAIRKIEPVGVNHIVEATGIPEVIETALSSIAKLGTCALVGAPSRPGETAALRFGLFVQNGVTLRGVIEGDSEPHAFIPELVAMQAAGHFPFERLMRVYDFDNINEAVADQKMGICVKAVLRMN